MSANLSKIFLDTSLIELAVRNFDTNAEVAGPKQHPNFDEYTVTLTGEKSATLHVYKRNDGLTTLNAKVGGNQALSQRLGEHVANACRKKEYKQRQLSLGAITTAHWDGLIKHLGEVGDFNVTEEKHEDAVRFRVRKGPGDEVLLHRFTTGSFLMQGKCRDTYATVAATLCALVPNKREMVQAQLKALELDHVKADELLAELQGRIPSAMRWFGEVGAAILAPCLAVSKVTIDLPDYSMFVHPAFRGLEAYMKTILVEHGYAASNSVGIGRNYFNGARLLVSVRDRIGCEYKCRAVEEAYALYEKHRHSLFHVDANVETSRTIDTQDEAISLVDEVLRCLQDTASKIP